MRQPPFAPRRGMTLLELLVVVAILGITAGIVGVSFAQRQELSALENLESNVNAARRLALTSGRPVTIAWETDSAPEVITAMPDGSVLVPGGRFDRLSGRSLHGR